MRVKVVDLNLFRNQVLVILLDYFAGIQVDYFAYYYLFLRLPDFELLIEQVPTLAHAYIRVKLSVLGTGRTPPSML